MSSVAISWGQLDGIISMPYLQKLVSNKIVTRIQRGQCNAPALYDANSFPHKYKVEIFRRYPSLQEDSQTKPFIDTIVIDGKAVEFYEDYLIDGERKLTLKHQEEFTNAASVLNAMGARLAECDSYRAKSSHRKIRRGEFWGNMSKLLPAIKEKYPNALPEHPRKLQEKYRQYLQYGYYTFISNKFNNKNAGKVVGTSNRESIITSLISDPNNFDNEQIARMYNLMAGAMVPEWPKITSSTVANMRTKSALVTTPRRRGSSDYSNNTMMQIKRRAPKTAMQYWTLDGWDAELYYQKTTGGRTTYTNRLTMVVVLDACCKYPVGYAIGEQENTALISQALNNAIEHTSMLFGNRYRVGQIQSDRFAISAMSKFYEVVGDKVTPARAHNAKAKIIEPYFKYINKNYCQFMRNWSGFGVQSKKSSQPNVDFLNKNKKNFPDKAGLVEQLTQIVEQERNRKYEEYMSMWAKLPSADRLLMSEESYLATFGLMTGHMNSIEGSGMTVTIEGVKHTYDCFDISFRKYSHLRWIVKYDRNNLNNVLAVSEDGTKQFMLEEKYEQPMALSERQPGDAEQLARVNQFNKDLTEHIKEQICIADRQTREIFAHNSQLDNTLGKHLIVDSLGQHKSEKARKRLANSEDKTIKVIEKELHNEEDEAQFTRFDIY